LFVECFNLLSLLFFGLGFKRLLQLILSLDGFYLAFLTPALASPVEGEAAAVAPA